ncbi:oxidoreductase [Rubellimicrobium roseum]|uniref:oxidoreductase n=1 Tax=Rubellimicrobium roseum TaxID=687525 RepID=UPI00319DC0ED
MTGDIAIKNSEDAALFDRAMLEALGAETIETSTVWTDGVHAYTGVPLDTLLDHLGVEEGALYATALNDYAVEIPVSDAIKGGPVVAFDVDSAPMSVRDKGPLWLIYPFDANPDYRSEVIYSRSIWQLVRIEVESGP